HRRALWRSPAVVLALGEVELPGSDLRIRLRARDARERQNADDDRRTHHESHMPSLRVDSGRPIVRGVLRVYADRRRIQYRKLPRAKPRMQTIRMITPTRRKTL